jgi:hypothetical protein
MNEPPLTFVIPSKPERKRRRQRGTCCSHDAPTKNAATNGRAILGTYSTFTRYSGKRKVHESRAHFSRHARVDRTLLSAAFDLDLDFAGVPHSSRPLREVGISTPATNTCHPERSMRIRFTNPHAQSKDPYTLIVFNSRGEFARSRPGRPGRPRVPLVPNHPCSSGSDTPVRCL